MALVFLQGQCFTLNFRQHPESRVLQLPFSTRHLVLIFSSLQMARRKMSTTSTSTIWKSNAGESRSPFVYPARGEGWVIFIHISCLVPCCAICVITGQKSSNSGLFLTCSNYYCQQMGCLEAPQPDYDVSVIFLSLANTWIHSSYFLCLITLWLHQDKYSVMKIKLYCMRQLADK